MVAIVIKPSLERWLSCIKEVERQEVIPHWGGQVSGYCFVSNLDDRGPVSWSRITTLQMHSPKIPGVSQDIGSYLAAIIQNNDNDNIRFYLQDITQAYIKIALDLNLDFYIRPFSELISKLSASFDFIVKVIRPLYGKPEADNHWFAIYHPHYKENSKITEPAYDPYLLRPLPEIDEIR